MAKIFIVEDNSFHMEALEIMLADLGHEVVGKSQSAIEAFSLIKETDPEVVLMDINLNGYNDGLTLSRELKKVVDIPIIFTSALTEKQIIQEAVGIQPAAYLVKPIDMTDLRINIELALNRSQTQAKEESNRSKDKEFFSVRLGLKLAKLDFDQIKVLQVDTKNYVSIVYENGKNYSLKSSLKQILEELPASQFIQVHRNHAINLHFLDFIIENEQVLKMKDDSSIPIGKTYRSKLYKRLNIR